MVAPPYAKLNTFVSVTLYVPPRYCTQFGPFDDVYQLRKRTCQEIEQLVLG